MSYFKNFFFTSIILYLINISFLGSLGQSIYYLIFFERSIAISYAVFFCFFLCIVFYLVIPKFKTFIIEIWFNEIFIKYYLYGSINFVKNLQQNKPFLIFFFIHSFLSLLMLHLFMLFINEIEFLPEFLYHLVNIIRLFFYPVVIFYILLIFINNNYLQMNPYLENTIYKNLSIIMKEFTVVLADSSNFRKNPKTAVAIYTAVSTTGAVVGHKHFLNQNMQEMNKAIGLDIKSLTAGTLKTEYDRAMYSKAVNALLNSQDSAASITLYDVTQFLTGNPTIIKQYKQAMLHLKLIEREKIEQSFFQHRDISNTNSMLPLVTKETSNSVASGHINVPTSVESFFFYL